MADWPLSLIAAADLNGFSLPAIEAKDPVRL
jgi:hypothetical protein